MLSRFGKETAEALRTACRSGRRAGAAGLQHFVRHYRTDDAARLRGGFGRRVGGFGVLTRPFFRGRLGLGCAIRRLRFRLGRCSSFAGTRFFCRRFRLRCAGRRFGRRVFRCSFFLLRCGLLLRGRFGRFCVFHRWCSGCRCSIFRRRRGFLLRGRGGFGRRCWVFPGAASLRRGIFRCRCRIFLRRCCGFGSRGLHPSSPARHLSLQVPRLLPRALLARARRQAAGRTLLRQHRRSNSGFS